MIQEQIQSTMLSFKGDCSMVLCQVSFSLVLFLLVYFFALFMIMFLMVKINFDILRILEEKFVPSILLFCIIYDNVSDG
jgi:hypothetical protein